MVTCQISLCFYAPKQQALTSCTIHPNAILHSRVIHTNDANRLRVICPNETVGAAPVCPPERSRSGVSIPKTHALCAGDNDGCAPAGRHGRAHRHRPYQSPSYFSAQSHPNETNRPRAIPPNDTNHPARNPPKRNRRGGACVPARTSAQRRFHTNVFIYKTTIHLI